MADMITITPPTQPGKTSVADDLLAQAVMVEVDITAMGYSGKAMVHRHLDGSLTADKLMIGPHVLRDVVLRPEGTTRRGVPFAL